MNRISKDVSIDRLQKLLDEVDQLNSFSFHSSEFTKWHRDVGVAISYIFEDSSSHLADFSAIDFDPLVLPSFSNIDTAVLRQNAFAGALDKAIAILKSMIEEVEKWWPDPPEVDTPLSLTQPSEPPTSNEVFVIHGRDIGARETVARFLESLGIEPIILQERPDQGRTIIEKFEEYAQINFAVALFTPDDVGGLEDHGLRPRTRQNVIFEFGYFIGKYGRSRVRALVRGEIEIPSDYSGVLYIPFDESERWKMDLIRELKSAGFDIDANRAFD